jgi:hypothetical protein
MSRNLDPTLAASLSAGVIQPVLFVQITFNSGTEYVWSGIGDFDFNGHTFSGVGNLGSIGPIAEGSSVKADGTSVTLSGIGLSQIGVPGPPVTPPAPPFSPAPGESVAWAFATNGPGGGLFNNPPSLFNDFLGCFGSASGDLHSGVLSVANGQSIGGPNGIGLGWSDFKMPPEIPADGVITHVYPVVEAALTPGGFQVIGSVPSPPGNDFFPGGGYPIPGVGVDVGMVEGVGIEAFCQQSAPGLGVIGMNISFVGLAVYYTGTPQTKISLIYEALNDVRMGAPAKIWFGLMANGALIGTPYLVFSGTVDKPNVQIDEKTASITLALENRLVNLQRANQRRYTAADQKLAYPTDMAFNWVESLNDIALRWGS